MHWVILSAKYGFIDPDYVLPGPYNVTFKRLSTVPVGVATLQEQVRAQGLDHYERVIGLGGKDYRMIVDQAFSGLPPRLDFPFAGLKVGLAMQGAKRAIATATLLPNVR